MKGEILRIRNIGVRIGGSPALRCIHLHVSESELVSVIGILGSGKNSLSRLLVGEVPPDWGTIYVDGIPSRFRGELEAQGKGIFRITRNGKLIPSLSIAENLFLANGRLPSFSLIPKAAFERETAAILKTYGIPVDIGQPIETLPFAMRMMLELVKCVEGGARLVILDQAFDHALDDASTRTMVHLRSLMDRLRSKGIAFLVIANKHSELTEGADRAYVLSQGTIAKTFHKGEYDAEILKSFMIGQRYGEYKMATPRALGGIVLAVRGLPAGRNATIDFSVRAGEVFGLHDSNGERGDAVIEALYGIKRTDATILIDSAPYRFRDPSAAFAHGIGLISRHTVECLFPNLDIFENVTILLRERLCRIPGLLDDRLMKVVRSDVKEMAPGLDLGAAVSSLDPELKMELILDRWKLSRRKAIIIEQPSLNFDYLETLRIYEAIEYLSGDGCAVVVVSSLLEELNAICDTVLVLK